MTILAEQSAGVGVAILISSIGAVIGVMLGSISAYVAWQTNRAAKKNDEEHAQLAHDIRRIDGHVSDLRETRPRREEYLSHVAALQQNMNDVASEVHRLTGVIQSTLGSRDT